MRGMAGERIRRHLRLSRPGWREIAGAALESPVLQAGRQAGNAFDGWCSRAKCSRLNWCFPKASFSAERCKVRRSHAERVIRPARAKLPAA